MIFQNSTVQEIEFEEIIDFFWIRSIKFPQKLFLLKYLKKTRKARRNKEYRIFCMVIVASQMPRTHLVTMNKYCGLKQMSHFGPKNRGSF